MTEGRLENVFLSVGAMKAGTTWLYAVLSKHPQLCFSSEKELHFFYHLYVQEDMLSPEKKRENVVGRYLPGLTREMRPEVLSQGLRWCSDYLSEPTDYGWFRRVFPPHGPEAYICEFSNLTAHIPESGWREMLERVDNLRVVYVLRDPIKRLWSHIKFHLAFSGQIDHLESWAANDIEKFARQPFIWDNAEYGAVLARMNSTLPSDRFRVVFYEDIHADQRRVLREIEEFLGIDHVNYPESLLRQRPTEGPRYDEPRGFRDIFRADVYRICSEMVSEGVAPHPSWSIR